MRGKWLLLSEIKRHLLKENMICKRHSSVIFEEWNGDVSHIIKGRTRSQIVENGVIFECPECIKDELYKSITTTYYYCSACGMVKGLPNSRRPDSMEEGYEHFRFCTGNLYECHLCGVLVSKAEAFK